ncbi:GtrA family protein [Patescibacteria group bacterium]|nr:MAG: GtrA family protein [Patescibacteria group bacterium]
MRSRTFSRFVRYFAVGGSTFLIDLAILYALTTFFHVPYQIAVAIGFGIGVSLNYFIARRFVFKGTERTMHHGYVYFLSAGILGIIAVTSLVSLLVESFGFSLIVARVLVSGCVGIVNYLFNLHVNFKVVGKHLH